MRRVLVALLALALLGAGAVLGARHWLVSEARARAAQALADLRSCLLGGGLAPGERASARLRAVGLGVAPGDDWPGRCSEHAAELDDALDSPWVAGEVAPGAPARALVESEPEGRAAMADALFARLEACDLPPATPRVTPAPPPARPIFAAARPEPLRPEVPPLASLALDTVGRDRVRLLLPGTRELCSLAPPLAEASCRELAPELELGEGTRFARAAPEAPDLLLTRQGLFDAATGQRVFRPAAPALAQAAVRADGLVAILDAEPREGRAPRAGGEGPERLRLVRFAPGRPATSQRLPGSEGASAWLDDLGLVWWPAVGGRASTWPLGAGERGAAGELASGGRAVASCELLGRRLVLVAASGATSVLVRGRRGATSFAVGAGGPSAELALGCGADAALVVHRRGAQIDAERCTVDGVCGPVVHAWRLPADAEVAAVAALGDEVLVAYVRAELGLRVRIGAPLALAAARDQVLFDTAREGGLDVEALRVAVVGDAAVLLVRDRGLGLHVLRVDRRGVRPFKLLGTRPARG
ncbi:MAG: hypothetical protein IT373_10995 [Polyangiaceae bacterium]|nr:hypothetical protein [Polyangiaceae bacterium]